jgi:hypothetical protein
MCMDARVPQAQYARERPPMTRSRRCWTGLTVAGSRQLLPASLRAPTLGALPSSIHGVVRGRLGVHHGRRPAWPGTAVTLLSEQSGMNRWSAKWPNLRNRNRSFCAANVHHPVRRFHE